MDTYLFTFVKNYGCIVVYFCKNYGYILVYFVKNYKFQLWILQSIKTTLSPIVNWIRFVNQAC